MRTSLPAAQVLDVWLPEVRSVEYLALVMIRCPFCDSTHRHRVFDSDGPALRRAAPCSTELHYTVDLNAVVPSRPKRDVSHCHVVAGNDRDDQAMNVPVPNWTE